MARAVKCSAARGLERVTLGGKRGRRKLDLAIPSGDRLSANFIYREVFEKESYHEVNLSVGFRVLDVGANVGIFALWAAERVGESGSVVCFEPSPAAFDALESNCEDVEQVEVRRIAIGSKTGTASMTSYTKGSGWSSLMPSEESVVNDVGWHAAARGISLPLGAERVLNLLLPKPLKRFIGRSVARFLLRGTTTSVVQVDTLSNQLQPGWDKIDLLKIDVERSEWDVIQGIGDGDWRRIDQVLAEVHDGLGAEADGLVAKFVGVLEQKGFEVDVSQTQELVGSNLYQVLGKR
ncbi:methyltransferase FkbM [Chloropicon primus]|uniref:Methyltransferase FkbM n=1 Tax=Chloropicon primus TaxID=1764295 RepID=A0A5B8MIK9_9CHLO|nr:methyltransferase FkbM [Chloropicon primus]UPQ99115.1 methyltransferase FkbM [Chloropicon primus]|eukprot:QDZ19904.1 methyltransferase FkbM [Chloropicon primus]